MYWKNPKRSERSLDRGNESISNVQPFVNDNDSQPSEFAPIDVASRRMCAAGSNGMDPHLRSLAEEIANSLTHGIGLILSLVGSSILFIRVLSHPDAWRLIGCGVFATALVAVYAASTL